MDELQLGEPAPPGGLARRLGAHGGGRRAATALILGVAGLGAFTASLLLDWLEVTVQVGPDIPELLGGEIAVGLAGGSYAVVYEVGVLSLLGVLASGILRPGLAARLRVAAVALGLGVVGVVAAVAIELGESGAEPVFAGLGVTTTGRQYLAGLYCAVAAVVALVVGTWLAASGPTDVTSREPVGAQGNNQAPITAFLAGVVGAGAFIASMVTPWQEMDGSGLVDVPVRSETSLGVANSASGMAYLFGALALLGVLGVVAARADLAARLRPAATGVALGTVAILVGTFFEMREWMATQYFAIGGFFVLSDMQDDLAALEYRMMPGAYLGLAAVVVLLGGLWLAASPASAGAAVASPSSGLIPEGYVLVPASALTTVPSPDAGAAAPATRTAQTPASPGPAHGAQPTPAPVPGVSGPAERWLGPVGHVDGLSVTASQPIDTSSQTDILRS